MLRITVKFNHWLPTRLGVTAITLYPFIFIKLNKETSISSRVINHEWIHINQVRSIGWFKFYMSYLYKYTSNIVKLRDTTKAYMTISYETDAYEHQNEYELPVEALEAIKKAV